MGAFEGHTLMVGLGWWGCAKKGLSVDDEKQWKARRRDFARRGAISPAASYGKILVKA